ncbi:MAG TPA: helicase-exonuclease AddAB subunit AddB [Eubacteriaceae bacterium]|nr:helicase-exonuclease AddAB subunit AddB [Eubacteriaceae bacterium]
MSVKYILGRAARGKTHRVFEDIKLILKNTENERLILVVPEQYTLQAERDLIQYLNTPGIMRIEVLSFTRLAYHVFNETGGITRVPIDQQGKSMMIRKVINEIQDQLNIYNKTAIHYGFISKFIELVSALKKNNVYPQHLKMQLELMKEGMMKEKLKDITNIYDKLLEKSQASYMDSDDAMDLLLEKIDQSSFLRNSHIWIDGFSNFPLQTTAIIQKLMKTTKSTTISLPMDNDEAARDREVFFLSKKIYKRLKSAAREMNLKEEVIDLNHEENKYINGEIRYLERELYSYPYYPYNHEVKNIEIFKGSNIYSEIEYMVAKVVELVRERGYRWREIAIVSNDMESYGSIIKRTLDEHQIPYFLDQKRSIMNNPIIQFILSTLEVITKGYRYEEISRLFKTGFSPLTIDQYEKLELYILQYGIRGNKWKAPFEYGKEEELEQLNNSRETFIQPLLKMQEKIKGKNSFEKITRILFEYLEEVKLRERLEVWIANLREQGLYEYVNENTQIWNIVMNTLDQLVEILGQERIALREYYSILESGFSSYEIGIIPTTLDQVLVGQIQRSKSQDIKALFIVGVNDGVLPSGLDEKDILSNEEKVSLQEFGIDLGTDYESRSLQERYLIYSSMAKPQDYLWLSCALADGEGKALRPSSLIDRIKMIFPKLVEKNDIIEELDIQKKLISTPQGTFKHLVENLRTAADGGTVHGFWWEVYRWFYQQEQWKDIRENIIEGLFHKNQVEEVGSARAKYIYKYPIYSSVSRLEGYANCPFAHFIKYGLRPREVKEYKVEAPDVGVLLHESLSMFTDKLKEENLDWRNIDRETADKIMDTVVDKMVPSYGEGVFESTHRYKYLVKRLKRISRRAIWTLTSHLKAGEFNLLYHEIAFGRNGLFPPLEIELSDGSKVFLEGRIDRVDILQGDGEDYVKIIDYKSGGIDFNLSDIYYGLSLQLIVYIGALLQQNSKRPLKPAGIFYFKIDDPMVKSDEKIIEKVEEEIEKELKMKGLALKDINIIRAMDRDIKNHSKIIPVGLTKEDKFYKNSPVLEEEDFYQLLDHAMTLVKDISEEMLRGNIRIYPVKQGKKTACDYCEYRGICQFDTLFEDNYYHNINKLNNDEVIKVLQSKQGVKDND